MLPRWATCCRTPVGGRSRPNSISGPISRSIDAVPHLGAGHRRSRQGARCSRAGQPAAGRRSGGVQGQTRSLGRSPDLLMRFLISAPDIEDPGKVPDAPALGNLLQDAGRGAFKAKLDLWADLGRRHNIPDLTDQLLSLVMLQVLDEKWKDHLYDLDQLRNAIQYRAWGQKDPLVEYKQEAYDMFVDLMHDIRSSFTERLIKFQVQITA